MRGKCLSGKYLKNCGSCQGFSGESGGELYLKGNGAQGYFVSRIYDSGVKGMQWNRLILDIGRNAAIQIYVWLFDRREEGERADRMNTAAEQYEYVKRYAQYYSEYRQMLLYGQEKGRGRFARLAVRIYSRSGSGKISIKSFALSFPKDSFTGYLSELYRNNVQLERFLAVQQSIYLELEEDIDTLGEKLDYVNCSESQAKKLAGWMGWGEPASRADAETLRRLLATGVSLLSRKGTCDYYIQLTEILTGEKAFMVEEPEHCRAMVLVRREPKGKKKEELDWLRRNVPIGMDIRFLVLDKTDRLDGLFFLDETAMLSQYESELTSGGVRVGGIVLL
ncbi:MAG: hypothetical protein NC123_10755 [Butyrivibrio sp.]|nr:hypothetical protein [Acetatifactor muris]MCM1560008.1 hypothetical protein [Butyrivibrio sp.]